MEKMEISIVIPVRNRAGLVGRTLESVKRQTYRPLHLVLVDNASVDDTLNVLHNYRDSNEDKDFRITVVEESRQGAAIARNTGAAIIDSDWLMFFDSDDVMDERLIEKYVERIEADKATDLVITTSDFNTNGVIRQPFKIGQDLIVGHLLHGLVSTQCFIVRKTLFDAVGGWNEKLRGWDDWDLGLRLLLANPHVAYLTDGNAYVHVMRTDVSITGLDYSTHYHWWEEAVDAMEAVVRKSENPRKSTILKYLEFRRVLLAGHYWEEGKHELSMDSYSQVYARVRNDSVLKWLFPLVYRYRRVGGRGSGYLMKLLVK